MKKLLLGIMLSFLFSCANEKLDMNASVKTAEVAIQLIGDEKYEELAKLYTVDFTEGESKVVKEKKFSQIIKIVGNTQSYTLIDSSRVVTDEVNRIVLKYSVKHAKVTTTETYTIAKEEGNYLIADIYITNK